MLSGFGLMLLIGEWNDSSSTEKIVAFLVLTTSKLNLPFIFASSLDLLSSTIMLQLLGALVMVTNT